MAKTKKKRKGKRLGIDGGQKMFTRTVADVEEVFADKDGMVRQVMVRAKGGKFKRHVHELCLIEEATENEQE